MMKRIMTFALIQALLVNLGCYSTQTITSRELEAQLDRPDISVSTNHGQQYRFREDNYIIQGDSLRGFGIHETNDRSKAFHGYIALANIASVKVEKFDIGLTIIAIGLPIGIVVGVMFWLSYQFAH